MPAVFTPPESTVKGYAVSDKNLVCPPGRLAAVWADGQFKGHYSKSIGCALMKFRSYSTDVPLGGQKYHFFFVFGLQGVFTKTGQPNMLVCSHTT